MHTSHGWVEAEHSATTEQTPRPKGVPKPTRKKDDVHSATSLICCVSHTRQVSKNVDRKQGPLERKTCRSFSHSAEDVTNKSIFCRIRTQEQQSGPAEQLDPI